MRVDSERETITVGLIQIAGLSRPHQQRETWTLRNDVLMQRSADRAPDGATYVYLPYSIGLLQAYAERHAPHPERYRFLQPLFKPTRVADAVAHLRGARCVGFSTYIWNIRLSLAIARALKAEQPNTLIVFGGPQVPDRAEAFLRENPWVDIVCHGEGEPIFLALLEAYPGRDWSQIPSISYLAPDGAFINHSKSPRLVDLSEIPSPYLAGIFDGLMRAYPEHEWLITCETNRGCPFSCSFCDWGSATASKVYRFDMERVKAEIEWFASHRLNRIFICDANFGLLPRDIEIAEYLVQTYKKHRVYLQVIIQNTKNRSDRAFRINKILSEIATSGVTLALQSVDPQTLRNIKRDNISLEAFHDLQRLYMQNQIDTYTDMILGLPGETYDTFTNGIAQVMANGQHNRLALYNCSILPNAEMGDPAYQHRYGLVTVPVPMVNEHESLAREGDEEVMERLDTVVATASMPPAEWVRAKVFAWMTELLHYDRLLQVALVVLHEQYGVGYRDLIESITNADGEQFPVCAAIREMFIERAEANRAGEPDYVAGEKWLNIWWPVHQYAVIELVAGNRLDDFYREAKSILARFLQERDIWYDPALLDEAISFNQQLLSVPYQLSDLDLTLSYNLWEFYQGVLDGTRTTLSQSESRYLIDRTSKIWLSYNSWCADLIGRHYQRGSYLYPISPRPPAEGADHMALPQAVASPAD